MPGIAGLVDVGNTFDAKALLQQMLEKMKHEQFHVVESHSDPPAGIGRVHLGLENDHRQPVFDRDQKKCIVMVGGVYSYRNLPKRLDLSPSERTDKLKTILHMYSRFGPDFVNFLNGIFSMAIWDTDAKKLLIANDRYGLLPVYYANHEGTFLFASEVKSLLLMKSLPRKLDERSVADFFSFGYILGDKTLFKDVKMLPPASIFTADARKNDVSMRKYWDFSFVENERVDLEAISRTIQSLLKNAVRRQIPDKKRFGVALSGGIDSRTILAEIEKPSLDQIFAFTIGMKESSDRHIAGIVCAKLGIPHNFFELTAQNLRSYAQKAVYLTDGMWLFHHSLGAHAINPKLREHFDTVFLGTAGGLMRGTFISEQLINAPGEYELSKMLFRKINALVPYSQQRGFYSPAYRHIAKFSFQDLQEEISKSGNMSSGNKADHFFIHSRTRKFINLGIVNSSNFFECRTPFYDYDLVDFIQTVPPRYRLGNRAFKRVFSIHYPELSSIPYARYLGPYNVPMAKHLFPGKLEAKIGNYLANSWIKLAQTLQSISSARIKSVNPHPIADANHWFRTELQDFIESVLLDSETLARPYFNQNYIARLIRRHMTGKANLADVLGALVTFELWHRMFFDQ